MALRCGFGFALGAIILVLLSISGTSLPANPAADESKITVGGTENWRFGFNYSDWALKTAPFHINDTLVFNYFPPSNGTFGHNVFLLKNHGSFNACDFHGAKLVANVSDGGGEGFKFLLKKSNKYFFACGVHDGIHCSVGLMKFIVHPLPFKRCDG